MIRPTEDTRVADTASPREAKRGTVVETGRPAPVNGCKEGHKATVELREARVHYWCSAELIGEGVLF